jgi:hypothetical protein
MPSDTDKKVAKKVKRIAEDELGVRPSHMFCIQLVEKCKGLKERGDSAEVFASRVYEANRDALKASGERRKS